MPVPSFVPAPVYDWSLPAVVPPPVPPEPRPRRRKRRPRARAKIPAQVRTILIDRLEAAIDAGLIALCAEDMPCAGLDFTREETELLMRILLGDDDDTERGVNELRAMLAKLVRRKKR